MGAMLHFCVSLSAADYAAERSAANLRAPRGGGIWIVRAGMGKLGMGPGEEFSADVVRWRAAGDDAVLGDRQITKALVVLVLDPDNGGRAVRGLCLPDCG